MALTEDAKKEIAEAIRIIREDRFERFARESLSKHAPKVDPIITDDPEKDGPTPPPEKDPEPEPEPTPKSRSRYWGDIFED